jgi:hypothetical protein
LATAALALGSKSIERKNSDTWRLSRNEFNCKIQLQKFNLNNIEFVVTEFGTYLENGMCRITATKQFTLNTEHFALIYFDGNHQKSNTRLLWSITHNNK